MSRPRRVLGPQIAALAFASFLAACGGSPFTAGGADGGGPAGDGNAPEAVAIDAPQDVTITPEGGADVVTHDALPDVVDEPAPPSCGGSFACVPAVPTGWSGPVELFEGSGGTPPCTSDFATVYDGNEGIDAPPAICSCSCDITPTTCSTSTTMGFTTSSLCTTLQCFSDIVQTGACVSINDQPACAPSGSLTTYLTAANPTPTTGTCTPQTAKQVPPVSWLATTRACGSTVAVAQVDCQAGSVCAPKPASPYGSSLCILQQGDLTCPAAYSAKHLAYSGADDSRSCAGCTCGSASGGTCSGTVTAYSSTNGSCTGSSTADPTPVKCVAVPQPADMRVTVTSTLGSCPPSTGAPQGTATAAGPTTVCCLQ